MSGNQYTPGSEDYSDKLFHTTVTHLGNGRSLTIIPNSAVDKEYRDFGVAYWANSGVNEYGSLTYHYKVKDIPAPSESAARRGTTPAHLAALGVRAELSKAHCSCCGGPLVLSNRTRLQEALHGETVACRYCDHNFSTAVGRLYLKHTNKAHKSYATAVDRLVARKETLSAQFTLPDDSEVFNWSLLLLANAHNNHNFDILRFIGASSTRAQILALAYVRQLKFGGLLIANTLLSINHVGEKSVSFNGRIVEELLNAGWLYPAPQLRNHTATRGFVESSTISTAAIADELPGGLVLTFRGTAWDGLPIETVDPRLYQLERALLIAARYRLSILGPRVAAALHASQHHPSAHTSGQETTTRSGLQSPTTENQDHPRALSSSNADEDQSFVEVVAKDLAALEDLINDAFIAAIREHLSDAIKYASGYPLHIDVLDEIARWIFSHCDTMPYGQIMATISSVTHGYISLIRDFLCSTHDGSISDLPPLTRKTRANAETAKNSFIDFLRSHLDYSTIGPFGEHGATGINNNARRWHEPYIDWEALSRTPSGIITAPLGWEDGSTDSVRRAIEELDRSPEVATTWAHRPPSQFPHKALRLADLLAALQQALMTAPESSCFDPDNPSITTNFFLSTLTDVLGVPRLLERSAAQLRAALYAPGSNPVLEDTDKLIGIGVGLKNPPSPLLQPPYQGDAVEYCMEHRTGPSSTELNNPPCSVTPNGMNLHLVLGGLKEPLPFQPHLTTAQADNEDEEEVEDPNFDD